MFVISKRVGSHVLRLSKTECLSLHSGGNELNHARHNDLKLWNRENQSYFNCMSAMKKIYAWESIRSLQLISYAGEGDGLVLGYQKMREKISRKCLGSLAAAIRNKLRCAETDSTLYDISHVSYQTCMV